MPVDKKGQQKRHGRNNQGAKVVCLGHTFEAMPAVRISEPSSSFVLLSRLRRQVDVIRCDQDYDSVMQIVIRKSAKALRKRLAFVLHLFLQAQRVS
jgi:hypothetical protein